MAINKSSEFEHRKIRLAQLSKALGHPARLAILELVKDDSICNCGDIAKKLPLAQSTISQHIKILKDANLIEGKVKGIKICYEISTESLNELKINLGDFIKVLNEKRVNNSDIKTQKCL